MTLDEPVDNRRPSNGDLYARLDRIEDKLDRRLNSLDAKVDAVAARQDRLEGRIEGAASWVKWLGPLGIAALIYGLLVSQGFTL